MEDSFKELLNQIRTHKQQIMSLQCTSQVLGVDDFDLEGVLPEGFLEKIIYGQQRLGKKDDSKDECFDESASTRPYPFEAWEVREKRKIEKPLMNWRFSALKNEIDMKDNLK
ncbi:hypothetical protein D8674_018922 [Pyrus ussuriensis x Pyrus communis]|uniref:Uncharacterized protein n=1 Tax=Pyrus ussuriensis x Pyrus communis TaxID=2448454 RepID=A0A5N5GBJ1_9ROSA|nr:hypothetical protein D8674_018922 [Pyrus ussuriensis x Pyrus communis]